MQQIWGLFKDYKNSAFLLSVNTFLTENTTFILNRIQLQKAQKKEDDLRHPPFSYNLLV